MLSSGHASRAVPRNNEASAILFERLWYRFLMDTKWALACPHPAFVFPRTCRTVVAAGFLEILGESADVDADRLASPSVCLSYPPSSALPRQEVCRLYRASLKLLDSWAIDRTIFNEEATKIRASVRACVFLPAAVVALGLCHAE